MRIDIVSLFPDFFDAFFNHSIIKRAIETERLSVGVTNPRDFSHNKHGQVDDGVLGAASGAQEDSFYEPLLECPQYTKPPEFRGWSVPDVLRSGHHKNIATWRQKEALKRTRLLRPDLLERPLTKEEIKLLKEIVEEESVRHKGEE
ncbi:MAG: hypothetical protein E6246_05300 [Veillonella sp.]|nr:hypothetical protein [Veillonella sp.]